jgi:adenosylcobinamide kinase/adenosylcobinamide-phosphate guanylyltransferase
LITGGVRGGKSSFALKLAQEKKGKRIFIATAPITDDEMEKRILLHREERGDRFVTVEEELHLAEAFQQIPDDAAVVVLDCLTTWVNNLYYHNEDDEELIKTNIELVLSVLRDMEGHFIIVTNEVGWGIVPENKLARSFRDTLGYLNAAIARMADTVYLCACGIPLKIKG